MKINVSNSLKYKEPEIILELLPSCTNSNEVILWGRLFPFYAEAKVHLGTFQKNGDQALDFVPQVELPDYWKEVLGQPWKK